MAQAGERCRGVVFLPEEAGPGLLDEFEGRGVRGIRLDLFKADADGLSLAEVRTRIDRAAAIAERMGWHLEFYSPGRWVHRLLPHLAGLTVDFCVNHMGYMTAGEGLGDAEFGAFVELARSSGRCWVKLTGPYRIADDGLRERTDGMARALVAAAPDRLVWGTDWPHIPHSGRDTGELLNRLAVWCPDPGLRSRILVDNPGRLYQF